MKKLFSALLVVAVIVIAGVFASQYLPSFQQQTPTPTSSNLQVTFLDVGQADAILVQCDSSTMLIDAGKNDTATNLGNNLKSMNVSKIEVLVGTHPPRGPYRRHGCGYQQL